MKQPHHLKNVVQCGALCGAATGQRRKAYRALGFIINTVVFNLPSERAEAVERAERGQ